MASASAEPRWSAEQLLDRLESGAEIFVLDVRNRDEFASFRIEGRAPVPSVNVPYFELLELGGRDDMLDSVVAYAERELSGVIPGARPVLAVCAKGDTSEYVAEGLRRLGYPCASLAGGMRAWGGHHVTRAVLEDGDLGVYQISRPARGCLSYVVAAGGRAVVIDPLRHLDPYRSLARERGLTIEAVIDTHGHADHISGGTELARSVGAFYHLHPYDAVHPLDMLPATLSYEPIRDRQIFRVGGHELEAIHIPGHTLGLVALRLDGRHLFTGDSIFIRSIARPDLGGKAEAWAPLHTRSLRRLLDLPGETTILPGHCSGLDEADARGRFAASLDELRRSNDGLLTLQKEDDEGFVRYLLQSLPRFVPEYVEIKRVNAGLITPNEEDAGVLELGKNLCALAQAYGAHEGGGDGR